MMDWIDFDRWRECVQIERPGIIFEVESAEGQRLFTACQVPLTLPFNWTATPVRFRPVPEPEPRHSTPLPKPLAPTE